MMGVALYSLEPQQDVQYARNAAAKTAQTAIIACFDDDAIADPRWLEELLKVELTTNWPRGR